jgi:hypothetical protein
MAMSDTPLTNRAKSLMVSLQKFGPIGTGVAASLGVESVMSALSNRGYVSLQAVEDARLAIWELTASGLATVASFKL